jgi:hypothetical protein
VHPMSTRKQTRWARPVRQIVEIMWSAPIVIGHRVARVRDRRELRRMVQEKVEGVGQAAWAAVTTSPRDPALLLGNVLAPIHRRVVANRRRLSGAEGS